MPSIREVKLVHISMFHLRGDEHSSFWRRWSLSMTDRLPLPSLSHYPSTAIFPITPSNISKGSRNWFSKAGKHTAESIKRALYIVFTQLTFRQWWWAPSELSLNCWEPYKNLEGEAALPGHVLPESLKNTVFRVGAIWFYGIWIDTLPRNLI